MRTPAENKLKSLRRTARRSIKPNMRQELCDIFEDFGMRNDQNYIILRNNPQNVL